MIHIRVDDHPENARREFACSIGPELPQGDTYYFQDEPVARLADCPGCNPEGPKLGIPISQLSGRSGQPGYQRFLEISASWGFP